MLQERSSWIYSEMKDIRAKILSNENIGPGYFKMALDAPFIARSAKPGQFVMVRCSDGLDPLLRRPLGVHRVARQKGIELLYEAVGKGTELLSKKKKGGVIDVLGPLGNGFTLPSAVSHQLSAILVTGGIGVAPLVFLAQELARKKVKTTVLIGAKTKRLILCEKDFRETGAKVHIATDDGSHGCKGLVSKLFEEAIRATGHGVRATVYACGPQPMLQCIAGICKKRNIECQVSLEENMACGIGACLGCAVKVKTKIGFTYKLTCKDGPIFKLDNLSLHGCLIWKRDGEGR